MRGDSTMSDKQYLQQIQINANYNEVFHVNICQAVLRPKASNKKDLLKHQCKKLTSCVNNHKQLRWAPCNGHCCLCKSSIFSSTTPSKKSSPTEIFGILMSIKPTYYKNIKRSQNKKNDRSTGCYMYVACHFKQNALLTTTIEITVILYNGETTNRSTHGRPQITQRNFTHSIWQTLTENLWRIQQKTQWQQKPQQTQLSMCTVPRRK